MTCSNGCWRRRCAPAASSPRCSPRTSARRRPGSTTAGSSRSRSGRDRGAGIRVVAGDTTGFAHTADLSEAGLRGRGRGGRRGGQPGRRRRPRTVALDPPAPAPGQRRRAATPTTSPRPPRSSCCAGSTRPPAAAGAAIVQVVGRLRRQPQADPRRQQRRPARRRRPGRAACCAISVVATGDTGMQTGFQSIGHTIGFELFDRVDVEELAREAARQALTKLDARPAPSGTMPVVIKHGQRRRAVPRGVRPRPRGRPRRQGRLGVRAARSASWSPRRSSRSSTTAPWPASGARFAIDDEGHPTPAQRADRGRRAHRLHVGLPAVPQGGPRAQSGNGRRQSYMHLPMVRMTNTFVLDGTDDPDDIVARAPSTACTSPSSAAAGQHRHRRLRVRHDRGLPDRERRDHRAAPRGQPHRQRPAGAARHRRCSATTSPWAARARAARTARACPSATASRRCGSKALTIGGTAA